MLKYQCILRPFFLKGFTHPDHNRPRVIIWLWWCQIPLVLSATRFFEKPTKRAPRFGFMSSSLGPRPLFVRSDIRASWLRGLWERRDALLSLCVQWWGQCSVVVDITNYNKGTRILYTSIIVCWSKENSRVLNAQITYILLIS